MNRVETVKMRGRKIVLLGLQFYFKIFQIYYGLFITIHLSKLLVISLEKKRRG